jgi:hypothetical protein
MQQIVCRHADRYEAESDQRLARVSEKLVHDDAQ